ncbi:hypothetical protein [Paenibacillus sp. Root444D2]|uniref:hypothetical protein n=1 Tax=Paenibacillus sp. Root444D2 TaxID=1736538 RepID=UPI000AABE804|nr:hypothetical protein [Paenibacillus sp. Root444D2]
MCTSDQLKFVVQLSNGKIISQPMPYKDAQQVFINLFDQVSGIFLVTYDPSKDETQY